MCKEKGEERPMVWLDGQWEWCPTCNFSRQFLTEAQKARTEQVTRRDVKAENLITLRGHSGSRGTKRKKRGGEKKKIPFVPWYAK
ncbi:MAG: hypothetical protein GX493_06165 [Firmicutes bacterium]|nr:hypothetical protein [Bacillota bacterium]